MQTQLPGFQDYLNALRNSRFLGDAELQQGHLVMTKRGRPLSYTGNFALTVAFDVDNTRYAVRCFLRHVPEVATRYREISQFVKDSNSEILADIEYQDRGILVEGTWYAICKMEWVEGSTLDRYVEGNLDYPPALSALPNQFLHLVQQLDALDIAHGDLQHGNIIADGNRLRLVDYDGMYVPSFDNMSMQSTDIGHRHYQHPGRNQADFHRQVDNFSTISIYLSLKALEHDAKTFDPGLEAIYLCETDYKDPLNSPRLATLKELGYESAVEKFIAYCQEEMTNVPSLTEFIKEDPVLYDDLSSSVRRSLNEKAVIVQRPPRPVKPKPAHPARPQASPPQQAPAPQPPPQTPTPSFRAPTVSGGQRPQPSQQQPPYQAPPQQVSPPPQYYQQQQMGSQPPPMFAPIANQQYSQQPYQQQHQSRPAPNPYQQQQSPPPQYGAQPYSPQPYQPQYGGPAQQQGYYGAPPYQQPQAPPSRYNAMFRPSIFSMHFILRMLVLAAAIGLYTYAMNASVYDTCDEIFGVGFLDTFYGDFSGCDQPYTDTHYLAEVAVPSLVTAFFLIVLVLDPLRYRDDVSGVDVFAFTIVGIGVALLGALAYYFAHDMSGGDFGLVDEAMPFSFGFMAFWSTFVLAATAVRTEWRGIGILVWTTGIITLLIIALSDSIYEDEYFELLIGVAILVFVPMLYLRFAVWVGRGVVEMFGLERG